MKKFAILLTACILILGMQSVWALQVVPNSFTGGTPNNENDGSVLENVADNNTTTYFQAAQLEGQSRWSFVLDLETPTLIESIAIWGYERYRPQVLGPGGLTTISVGDSPTGPFTQIGSRDFGGDRATNPFSGGPKGQRIEADTPTTARYLKIEAGWTFDNLIRISVVQINPKVVLYDHDPLHNPDIPLSQEDNYEQAEQQNVFDLGGPDPRRSAHNITDGRYGNYGANPVANPLTLFIDVGSGQTVEALEIFQYDTDTTLLPAQVTVSVSSTDSPTNFDTELGVFQFTQETLTDASAETGLANYFKEVITLPAAQQKRYFKLVVQNNITAADLFRIGEIGFVGSEGGEPTPTPTPPPGEYTEININEDFATDPTDWVGVNNRTAPSNFGFTNTNNIGTGAGEAGGGIVRRTNLTYYALPLEIPLDSLDYPFSFEFDYMMVGDVTGANVHVGFFNPNTVTANTQLDANPNIIIANLDDGIKLHLAIQPPPTSDATLRDYVTGDDDFFGNHAVHHVKVQYVPTGQVPGSALEAGEFGQIGGYVDETLHRTGNLKEAVRTAPWDATHFGIFATMSADTDTPLTFYVDNIEITYFGVQGGGPVNAAESWTILQ